VFEVPHRCRRDTPLAPAVPMSRTRATPPGRGPVALALDYPAVRLDRATWTA
jgi:hypothetical protein